MVNRYERGSGSKLNYEKSEGIFIGQKEGRNTGPVPITWKTDNITVIGIQIGPYLQQDWEKPMAKLLRSIQGWYASSLTIYGRAVIIRTYGVANLIYLATTFSIPEKIILEVHQAIFNFVWKGHEYIKRETLGLPINEGGLAIPDLRKVNVATKVKWLREIGDKDYQQSWIKWPRYFIGTALSTVKEQWTYLREKKYPHADPNSVPPWYKIVHTTAKKYKEQLEKMEQKEITNKNLLIFMNEEIEQPRANRKWKEWKIEENTMKKHWMKIWKTLNLNWEKENLRKLTHMVLPTKAYLAKWKMEGVNDQCPFCKKPEDLNHVFLKCTRTKSLWEYVKHLIEKIIDKPSSSPMSLVEAVFHTKIKTKDPTQKKLVRYVTTTAITIIWNTRNAKLKEKKIPELKQELKRIIKDRVNVDEINNNVYNIKNIWSYENILMQVTGDKITFNL